MGEESRQFALHCLSPPTLSPPLCLPPTALLSPQCTTPAPPTSETLFLPPSPPSHCLWSPPTSSPLLLPFTLASAGSIHSPVSCYVAGLEPCSVPQAGVRMESVGNRARASSKEKRGAAEVLGRGRQGKGDMGLRLWGAKTLQWTTAGGGEAWGCRNGKRQEVENY